MLKSAQFLEHHMTAIQTRGLSEEIFVALNKQGNSPAHSSQARALLRQERKKSDISCYTSLCQSRNAARLDLRNDKMPEKADLHEVGNYCSSSVSIRIMTNPQEQVIVLYFPHSL